MICELWMVIVFALSLKGSGEKKKKHLNIYRALESNIQLTIRARNRSPPKSREWELTPPTSNNTILKPKLDLHFNQTQNSVNLSTESPHLPTQFAPSFTGVSPAYIGRQMVSVQWAGTTLQCPATSHFL